MKRNSALLLALFIGWGVSMGIPIGNGGYIQVNTNSYPCGGYYNPYMIPPVQITLPQMGYTIPCGPGMYSVPLHHPRFWGYY